MNRSSLTEETPAAPGWVDRRVREIFSEFRQAEAAADAYADCLAGVRGAMDVDAGHDRCRRAALSAAETSERDALDRALQALEAELSAST